MEKIAIPKDPLLISQTGNWSAIDDELGLQITGSATADENFAHLFRTINSQQKQIIQLFRQLREQGYGV